MEAQAVRSTHPLLIIAAVAVTLFSLVGIGAMLGWIPTTTGGQSGATAPAPAAVALAPAQPETPVAEQAKPAPKPVKKAASKHEHVPTPPVQSAAAMIPPPPPVAVVSICNDCGVIESVREIKKEGQGSGAGAVGGAVVGGVVGHQMGAGRGRDVMTVLGAVGGAVAGNQVEKNAKTSVEYRITVRFEDGTTRLYPSATPPAWRVGDKVKVVNGVIQSNS